MSNKTENTENTEKTKKGKKEKNVLKKQKGGNVLQAALGLVKSMDALRASITNEIKALGNFSSDFNKASEPAVGTPNTIK